MTRYLNKKSTSLTVVLSLIVVMALGLTDLAGENEADRLVHEFGDLISGVEAEILSIPNNAEPAIDTSKTLQTETILSRIAYLEAFDEVIRKQIF